LLFFVTLAASSPEAPSRGGRCKRLTFKALEKEHLSSGEKRPFGFHLAMEVRNQTVGNEPENGYVGAPDLATRMQLDVGYRPGRASHRSDLSAVLVDLERRHRARYDGKGWFGVSDDEAAS
jgi:hypothetical protein